MTAETYTEVLAPTASYKHRSIHWTPNGRTADGVRGLLLIETSRDRREYAVREFACDGEGRAFQVERLDGEDSHNVFLDADGTQHVCDCRGFESSASQRQTMRAVRRSESKRAFQTAGCRHVDALLAVRENGWLQKENAMEVVVDPLALLACPFCGSRAEVEEVVPGFKWWALCQGADCGISGHMYDSAAAAVSAWNRRPEPKRS